METNSEIYKMDQEYYTPLLATEGLIFLAKEQVGKSSKDDIKEAIAEYERLFTAGVGSPAELLTLYRYYGPKSKYAQAVKEQGLLDEENEPLVVGGPASVEGIDHENHLITMEALGTAFTAFMNNFRTRNCMVFHSDVQTGWALPAYITKTGKIFKSGVDEKGFFLVSELRSDTRVANRLIEEVIDGNILSYSIAGSATDVEMISKGSQRFMQVNALELAEITYCEKGVNQGAHFDILKSEQAATKSCSDGSCIPVYKEKALEECACKQATSQDELLLNKAYETNWYRHTISNYPEFDNTPFRNFVSLKSGYEPRDFNKIPRPEMDRIAVDYMKDAGAIKPEFSSAYVQKENNAYDKYPEFATMIEGDIFQKSDLVPQFLERIRFPGDSESPVADDPFTKYLGDTIANIITAHMQGGGSPNPESLGPALRSKQTKPVPQELADTIGPMSDFLEIEKQEESKMSKKNEFTEELHKQWQDPKMEYASNWEETEEDRRTKLKAFQEELGFPEHVSHDPDKGYPEVEEDEPLPWNMTSGVIDKS